MTTADPQVAEFLAVCGFDEVCVDQQHGLADAGSIAGAFRSIELHGSVPTTRVTANDPELIGKCLDLGALGVVVPMVETREAAARAVAATRFPPRGRRSAGPLRGSISRAEGVEADYERVAVIVMVETAEGLHNVDAIAATPGVDAVYIGPADLAVSLGLSWEPGEWSASQASTHAAAVERIREACERQHVTPGIHCGNGTIAHRYLDQGFRMLTVASDLALLQVGGRAELAAARGSGDRPPVPSVTV
jgi:4-hydroxy-2-oxoheptanedioate aldolase